MRSLAIALLAAAALPVHAQSVYRCGAAGAPVYQDRPCANGTEIKRGGYVQPAPSPGSSAADRYKTYLDGAASAAAAAPPVSARTATPVTPPPQTEAERRAVFVCNADQRVDEMRNGYARYSCDPRTGEKKLVERQVIVVDHDGRTRP